MGAFGCTARQPDTIAAVQNKTKSGSTVIRIVPAERSGVAVVIKRRKNPARALTVFAKNRSTMRLKSAAIAGEKNRMPKAVSPKSDVPRNCVYAISGGLL